MGSHVCPGTPRQQRKAKETWGPYLQAQKNGASGCPPENTWTTGFQGGATAFCPVAPAHPFLPAVWGKRAIITGFGLQSETPKNGFTSSNNDECHLPGSHHLHPLGISWGLRMRATIQFCETKRCRHAKQKETGCA